MPPPPVTIYVTSLTSQPKVRQHTELLHRSLKGLDIPYESFDLVNDPEAKTRWQRAKPAGIVVGLPGYLVGGEWLGTMDDFEYAVENAALPQYLKQDVEMPLSASGSGTVGEAELESLMRGMSDRELDTLAGQLGGDSGAGVVDGGNRVGLMVPEGSEPPTTREEDAKPAGTEAVAPITAGSPPTAVPPSPMSTTTSTHAAGDLSPSPSLVSPSAPVWAKDAKAARRNSKVEELAQTMREAGSVDEIMAAVEMAELKEKVD